MRQRTRPPHASLLAVIVLFERFEESHQARYGLFYRKKRDCIHYQALLSSFIWAVSSWDNERIRWASQKERVGLGLEVPGWKARAWTTNCITTTWFCSTKRKYSLIIRNSSSLIYTTRRRSSTPRSCFWRLTPLKSQNHCISNFPTSWLHFRNLAFRSKPSKTGDSFGLLSSIPASTGVTH